MTATLKRRKTRDISCNRVWQTNDTREAPVQSKHIYMGETRIATKNSATDNPNTLDEERRIYYYHSDHLGSARTVTNYRGDVHERLEYTPYGELWIDWKSSTDGDKTPFRFTGKERDEETGLYYYGARYLDPRTSRWLTTDPAMYQGDYIPSAPVNDEARKRNGNLPGQGGIFNTVNMHVYHYAGNNPVKYVDPDGLANVVVVVGESGGSGANFDIAANTWISENTGKDDVVKKLNASDYKNASSLTDAIKNAFGEDGIDSLAYFGHFYANALTSQADDSTRQTRPGADAWIFSFSGIIYNSNSNIYLYGCNAGNVVAANAGGVPLIAQVFANETGATVWGYDSSSFVTSDPVLGYGKRPPTNRDVLSKLSNGTTKAWFVSVNGKPLQKFTPMR